jgi:hypothetical protein
MPTTKVDGNLVHTPYNLNKDTCNKITMNGWGQYNIKYISSNQEFYEKHKKTFKEINTK